MLTGVFVTPVSKHGISNLNIIQRVGEKYKRKDFKFEADILLTKEDSL